MTSLYKAWIPEDLARYMPRPKRRRHGVASPRSEPAPRGNGARSRVPDREPAPPPTGRKRQLPPPPQPEIPSLEPVRALLARAGEAAGKLVEQAEVTAAAVREQAQAEGFEMGHQEGLLTGRKAADEARENALDLVRQAGEIRERAGEDARDDLVGVTLALARKIIRREIHADPTVVVGMVDEALESLPQGTEVLVRAHPSSIVVLRERRGARVGSDDGAYHLTYMSDEDMEPGDFMFETIYGQLDGRVKIQLARLAQEARRHITSGGESDGSRQASDDR